MTKQTFKSVLSYIHLNGSRQISLY